MGAEFLMVVTIQVMAGGAAMGRLWCRQEPARVIIRSHDSGGEGVGGSSVLFAFQRFITCDREGSALWGSMVVHITDQG